MSSGSTVPGNTSLQRHCASQRFPYRFFMYLHQKQATYYVPSFLALTTIRQRYIFWTKIIRKTVQSLNFISSSMKIAQIISFRGFTGVLVSH